jgi:O-antigen/teichoic acid export membrane protein
MVVIGFAGIINEMLDRSVMKYILPGTVEENLSQLGIYSACYKISIVMALFIQAFRFAAEPFFFAQQKNSNAPEIYAKVMNWFVLFCSVIFIFVTVFRNEFSYFVGEDFRSGISIVPILLLANLLFGIYVNLSIWYKLTDNTMMGGWVSISGALLTVLLLFVLVPKMGYEGAAWATLICYSFMAAVSYILGQKYFPVPYQLWKIALCIAVCVAVWILSTLQLGTDLAGKVLLVLVSLTTLFTVEIKTWKGLAEK